MKKYLLALFLLVIASPAFAVCGTGAGGCFWVGGTGTWDSSTTTHWASSSGGAGGVAVPISTSPITFDGSSGGGTVTISATISGSTFAGITMGAFTGTLDFATNPVTLTLVTSGAPAFSVTGTGTRTLSLGTSTFNLQAINSNAWDCTTSTNMTATLGSATFNFQNVSFFGNSTFVTGGALCGGSTYGILNVSSSTAEAMIISGNSAVFSQVNLTGPLRLSTSTITVTNAVNWAGSAANLITIYPTTGGTVSSITFSATGNVGSWVGIGGITAVTNGLTLTNSFNQGSNTNISITNPSVGGGSGHIIGG